MPLRNGTENVERVFVRPDHGNDILAEFSRDEAQKTVVKPLPAEGQREHDGIENDEGEENFYRNMIEEILCRKGRDRVEIEFQNDRFETCTDGKPECAVYGLPVKAVGKEKEGNGGDINECEFPMLKTFDAFQPLFAGTFGKPDDDRRKQGDHVDESKTCYDFHKIPLLRRIRRPRHGLFRSLYHTFSDKSIGYANFGPAASGGTFGKIPRKRFKTIQNVDKRGGKCDIIF